jgi:hypothetical protein
MMVVFIQNGDGAGAGWSRANSEKYNVAVDPLVGNDREIGDYTTAAAK